MERQVRSFEDLKAELQSSAALQDEFKTDPVNAIKKIEIKNALVEDPWIYRIVVLALGITIISIIIGVIVLIGVGKISDEKSVPTILTAIGSAAIGALAGLLAPSPARS